MEQIAQIIINPCLRISSFGFRTVIDEMIAYGYARFLFFPAK